MFVSSVGTMEPRLLLLLLLTAALTANTLVGADLHLHSFSVQPFSLFLIRFH